MQCPTEEYFRMGNSVFDLFTFMRKILSPTLTTLCQGGKVQRDYSCFCLEKFSISFRRLFVRSPVILCLLSELASL